MSSDKQKMTVIAIIYIIFLFSMLELAFAPPLPHNVEGRVFHSDGTTGIANGIPIKINNTLTGDIMLTYTDAPPIPSLAGAYSATINGSESDTIIVTAWNSTHYGINTSTLLATTTNVNVVINTTRPSEANITIINPLNNTLTNITSLFNVTANITIIGGQDGVNCNATINFSSNGVLLLTSGEVQRKSIGDISLGSSNISVWTVSANKSGTTNITLSSICASDAENFEHANIKTVYNITVQDISSPIIYLESPINNSIFTAVYNSMIIAFVYNVSDESDIANCSLILNNRINMSNYTVQKNLRQNITQNLSTGNYTWNINCTDNSTAYNSGASTVFNLTILPNIAPAVSNIAVETMIELNSGTTKIITCNATVMDENNVSDIATVNATLYSSVSFSGDSDDNNYHYTNFSCAIKDTDNYQANYTCSFTLQYYANNGTWACNITSADSLNATGSGNATAIVNELMSLEVSPTVINFTDLEPGNVSAEVNMTLTNLGNIPFNITVEGYGRTPQDNLSMVCVNGNITISSERYYIVSGLGFNEMTNLTDYPVQIANLTLPQRTNEDDIGSDRNQSYWRLEVPFGLQGKCNGTIIIKAVVA